MAFFSKVGSLLRQTASKQIGYELSASRSSIYQATRCMSSSKVFVGGLSFNIDDTSLREVFKKYGYVAEARVILDRDTGRSRGFGFVTFNSEEEANSAIQALDGQDIHGRVVKVNYAIDRARGGGGGYGGGGGGYGGGGYGGGGGGYGGGGGGYGGGANNYGSGGNYSSSYGGGNASYGGAGGNTFDSGNTGGISTGSENYGVAGGGGGIDGNTNNQFGSAGNQFGSADNQFGSFDSNESGSLTGAPDGPMEGNGDGFDDSSDFAKRA